jgi:hypothetical protein
VLGCSVLEDRRACLVEQSIDDGALGWGDDYRIHHLFPLVATAVTSGKFQLCAVHGDVEGPRIRGVGQVEPYDFAQRDIEGGRGLAVDEEDISEASHHGVRGTGWVEDRDPAVFE